MKKEREPMGQVRATFKVDWYRSPVAPDQLKQLTKRSDLKGALQAFGSLALLVALGLAAWYFAAPRPRPAAFLSYSSVWASIHSKSAGSAYAFLQVSSCSASSYTVNLTLLPHAFSASTMISSW
jgi:hypothetical protein